MVKYSNETILELVDTIYGAAADSAMWGTLLARLGNILGGSAGSLHNQHGSSRGANVAASWNIDALLIDEYVAHYSQVNPIFTLGKKLIRQGAVNPRQVLCPDDVLARSEYYNDYLVRLDAFQGVAATVLEDGPISANLTIFRPKNANPFDKAECKFIGVLMPHLQRAFQLHNRIQGLERKADSALDALDNLDQGVVLVDARGRVLSINRAADALLKLEKGLKLTTLGLEAATPSETKRLNSLIAGAAATGRGKGLHPGGVMEVSCGGGERPLQVLVTPLRTRTIHVGKEMPVVAIFVSDPERKPVSNSAVIAQLFGLTRAESRLAQILATGCDLKSASEQLGVAPSTVRSQLKSIFGKTNTNRQSQLVRMLLLAPTRFTEGGGPDGEGLQ